MDNAARAGEYARCTALMPTLERTLSVSTELLQREGSAIVTSMQG
jgi:hypothetical protein